jgi:hypothetical protein
LAHPRSFFWGFFFVSTAAIVYYGIRDTLLLILDSHVLFFHLLSFRSLLCVAFSFSVRLMHILRCYHIFFRCNNRHFCFLVKAEIPVVLVVGLFHMFFNVVGRSGINSEEMRL